MTHIYNRNKVLYRDNGSQIGTLILFYIIWPFGAWVYSLFRANKKGSYTIFFLFSLLLCWHMAPTGFGDSYDDFLGIMDRYIDANIPTSELLYQIKAFFTFSEDAPKELYENILIWFTKSNFGNNYHFYFLLASIPVAVCQLRSMRRITADARYKSGQWIALFILVLFIFPRDIITVQNPRFATGLWWNVMACIFYFCSQKKNPIYLVMVAISPLFHSGMWIFVIVVFSYLLNPFKGRILEVFAIVSMPFMLLNTFLIVDFGSTVSFLPDFLQNWATRSMDEDAYNTFLFKTGRSGFWWITAFFDVSIKILYCYMAYFMIKHKDEFQDNPEASRFFPFFLWFFACVNLMQSLPEASTRYYNILRIFEAFMWFKAFGLKYKNIIYMLIGLTSYQIFMRYGYVFGGALSVNTPIDVFLTPLPYLMGKGLLW